MALDIFDRFGWNTTAQQLQILLRELLLTERVAGESLLLAAGPNSISDGDHRASLMTPANPVRVGRYHPARLSSSLIFL